MNIIQLEIENFRNIPEICFRPCPGPNIIYGDNAQGKTNVLEAVWLFSGARSFRGAKDGEYIPFSGGIANLRLSFSGEGREQTASITYGQGEKLFYRNGIRQERASSFAGMFCTVVFSPDHLSLIKDGPVKRRKMVDDSLCQAYPKYGKILELYEKTLRQRNRLLKDIPRHPALAGTLDVWDLNLIEYGSYISHMRARYVARLGEIAAGIYQGIALGKEPFRVVYQPSFCEAEAGMGRQDYRERLEEAVGKSRAEDIRNGATAAGPHRDDLDIAISGVSARAYGSQGQQRSSILALKLAECRILEERNGEAPVILLDDVMSELDEHRRFYLLNQLGDRQVLITCCDASDFEGMENGKVFHIHGGKWMG